MGLNNAQVKANNKFKSSFRDIGMVLTAADGIVTIDGMGAVGYTKLSILVLNKVMSLV